MWTNSSSKQAPIYSTVEMVRAARPCLLPLLLLSLLVSYSIAPLKLKPPQLLSLPFLCPPRNVEQLLTLDWFSRLPLWDPYHLFFVMTARETMVLDLGENKNKQTRIKLYLRVVSPTLLARSCDPLSVWRIRRKNNSVSTEMTHVQTQLIKY